MVYLILICAILFFYFSNIFEAYDDLPWDDDVNSCDILRDTDQDLYSDVKNARRITLY